MSQSTRRWRTANFWPQAVAGAVLLAGCVAGAAWGQPVDQSSLSRLPPIQQSKTSGPPEFAVQTAGRFPSPAEQWQHDADRIASLRLLEHQEELPSPAAAHPSQSTLFEDDVVPLDFGQCGGCDTCGCECPADCRESHFSRFFWGFYHAVCCPDPCYEPCWVALADAAFFVESARPVTQTRLRWDAGVDMIFPDRAEYFWARSGGGGGLGPAAIETKLTYHELSHYSEVAHGKFGAFIELPYRSYDAEVNPHEAGFGDLIAGTKSMLLDCELIQITFQMKFITPVGVSLKGLGAGHLSLEPSLILGANLSPHSYLQAQVCEWIPIAGNPAYAGAILHYHTSYNRTLYGCPGGIHVIGTAEINGWSFQDGAYSDPVRGQLQQASNETYVSSGFGLRTVLCNKLDFGIGVAIALTENHWAEQLYRSELRVRF